MTPRDLKNGDDFNNQILWDDSPKYVSVFTLFCLNRRRFRPSPEALKTIFFLIFFLHRMSTGISLHDLIYVK